MLQTWRRQALLTHRGPDGYREALAAAAEVAQTGRPRAGRAPWSVVKAELGL